MSIFSLTPNNQSLKTLATLGCLLLVSFLFLGFSWPWGERREKIKIGVSLPLTGSVASYGIRAKKGMDIAVRELNKAGGIKGFTIRLIYEDDQNDAKLGANIMHKFANIDKFPAVIGSAGSSVTLAMVPIAIATRTVLISPISGSTELSKFGGEYFFRVCPADDTEGKILADWTYQDGNRSVAILFTNNAWGTSMKNAFIKNFTGKGGNIVSVESSNEESPDFRSQLIKIKEKKPDAICSPTYPKEGGQVVKQIKELGMNAKLYGGDNWGAPEFLQIAGTAAEDVFFVEPIFYESEEYKNFKNKFFSVYGENPDIYAAQAYDAVIAIALAIEKGDYSAQGIRTVLKEIEFLGVSGPKAFDRHGDIKQGRFAKMAIKNGRAHLLGTIEFKKEE